MEESVGNSTPSLYHSIQMWETDYFSAQESDESNETQNGALTHEARQQPYRRQLSRQKRKYYFKKCVPLYEAAKKGDIKTAKNLLDKDPQLLSSRITDGGETVLHVATGAKQTGFVKEITKMMERLSYDPTLPDKNGNTAFCVAAAVGAVDIAKIMHKNNSRLLTLRGAKNLTPLYMAAMFGQGTMASYLYQQVETRSDLQEDDRKSIFLVSIHTGLYGFALELLQEHPELAVAQNRKQRTALHMLARKPSAFASRYAGRWKRLINSLPGMKLTCQTDSVSSHQALELVKSLLENLIEQNEVDGEKLHGTLSKALIDAAKFGNFVFLNELLHFDPHLVHELDDEERTIFHIAVLYRHTKIFKLIYELGFDKQLLATYVDEQKNSLLHLAAKYPPPRPVNIVSGPALQMQQELLLFKEVEKMLKPEIKEKANEEKKLARDLFTEAHRELMRSGEKWMKDTASSCMLVATLIATVIFSAAFTVPGGNDSRIGTPIHLRKTMFQVFAVADAIALSSSSTSILLFLSILMSRFTEEDFLKWLPLQLMLGLLTLFISVISMMVAFSSNFFLAYNDRVNWVILITSILAILPPTLFALLQLPLLIEVFNSTFRSKLGST